MTHLARALLFTALVLIVAQGLAFAGLAILWLLGLLSGPPLAASYLALPLVAVTLLAAAVVVSIADLARSIWRNRR